MALQVGTVCIAYLVHAMRVYADMQATRPVLPKVSQADKSSEGLTSISPHVIILYSLPYGVEINQVAVIPVKRKQTDIYSVQ